MMRSVSASGTAATGERTGACAALTKVLPTTERASAQAAPQPRLDGRLGRRPCPVRRGASESRCAVSIPVIWSLIAS